MYESVLGYLEPWSRPRPPGSAQNREALGRHIVYVEINISSTHSLTIHFIHPKHLQDRSLHVWKKKYEHGKSIYMPPWQGLSSSGVWIETSSALSMSTSAQFCCLHIKWFCITWHNSWTYLVKRTRMSMIMMMAVMCWSFHALRRNVKSVQTEVTLIRKTGDVIAQYTIYLCIM